MAVLSSPSLFLGKTTVAWRIGIKWFAMQILFLDESGTAPARNAVERNPYFVLGGLIVPEAQWKSLQKDLRRLKGDAAFASGHTAA